MIEAPRPLRAFYGASDRQKHNNTVKSMACPGDRPQAIFTPQSLIDPILEVWPTIALDPCGNALSTVPADRMFVGKQVQKTDKKGRPVFTKDGAPKLIWVADGPDGLNDPWEDFTYSNPIFEELEDWMWKAAAEAGEAGSGKEIMQLVPVRTHRTWFCDVAATCTKIAWLKPVTFDTYDQAFPAPLAMLYWGVIGDEFAEAFAKVSCRVGDHL